MPSLRQTVPHLRSLDLIDTYPSHPCAVSIDHPCSGGVHWQTHGGDSMLALDTTVVVVRKVAADKPGQ